MGGWYAIRVLYGREMKLKEALASKNINSFIPMQWKMITTSGIEKRVLLPAVRNLIFIYSDRATLDALKKVYEECIPFRYIIDRAKNCAIVIPNKEMEHFITVSEAVDEQLLFLTKIYSTLRNGDKVRVTDGVFAGVEGYVVRIKKDKRVMVLLNNLVAVVTTHIRPSLLMKIE